MNCQGRVGSVQSPVVVSLVGGTPPQEPHPTVGPLIPQFISHNSNPGLIHPVFHNNMHPGVLTLLRNLSRLSLIQALKIMPYNNKRQLKSIHAVRNHSMQIEMHFTHGGTKKTRATVTVNQKGAKYVARFHDAVHASLSCPPPMVGDDKQYCSLTSICLSHAPRSTMAHF